MSLSNIGNATFNLFSALLLPSGKLQDHDYHRLTTLRQFLPSACEVIGVTCQIRGVRLVPSCHSGLSTVDCHVTIRTLPERVVTDRLVFSLMRAIIWCLFDNSRRVPQVRTKLSVLRVKFCDQVCSRVLVPNPRFWIATIRTGDRPAMHQATLWLLHH